MMRKLTITLALISTLFVPEAEALGLGHIQVYSKINGPFKAQINVVSSTPNEVSNLKVGLASASSFRRAGIERPYVLTNLRFKVQTTSKTTAIIHITTQESLKEPFINFLVEVSWPSGTIRREFTALLDPPLYKPKLLTASTKSYRRTATGRTGVSSKSPRKRTRRSTSRKKTGKKRRRTSRTRTRYASHTIRRGETLWGIAKRTLPTGASMKQHMLNIYNANQNAFIRRNRNLLKMGKVLRIPGGKQARPVKPRPTVYAEAPRSANKSGDGKTNHEASYAFLA